MSKFSEPLEIVDPNNAKSQKLLENQAFMLASDIVSEGMEAKDLKDKVACLNSYVRYRLMISDDPVFLVNRLADLSPKQLKLLEVALKQRKGLESFKSGKMSLSEVYSLPSKKRRK